MCVDEFIRGIDEILADPDLGDEVHNGKEQERLVGGLKTRKSRPALSVLVGPKLGENLKVFLNHRLRPTQCT